MSSTCSSVSGLPVRFSDSRLYIAIKGSSELMSLYDTSSRSIFWRYDSGVISSRRLPLRFRSVIVKRQSAYCRE